MTNDITEASMQNQASEWQRGFFFPAFFWLDSQRQKHETRGTFGNRNSGLMVYLKASRRLHREKRVNSVSRRRSLAFSVLIKHQEGIKEDNIVWGEESCDHGNVAVENIAGQIPIVALLSSLFFFPGHPPNGERISVFI